MRRFINPFLFVSLVYLVLPLPIGGASSEASSTPLIIPLIPHHVQKARRNLQESSSLSGPRPVPLHARGHRDLAATTTNLVQVAGLFQGYGTHYADLWVGTPPQRQTVIVDTGSGVTAFPCVGCNDCGVPKYHIDALFDFQASSTYQQLTCSECLRGTCGGSSQCQIGMAYQEGSSWSAIEVQDACYVGGLHERAVASSENAQRDDDHTLDDMNPFYAPAFKFPLKFGCQTKVTGLFKTQLADGIMGMDNANTAFWSQMSDKINAVDRKFSLCFSRSATAARKGTGAGAMCLGGYDKRLHGSDMVYADITPGQGFYQVHVRKVYLRAGGGESALSSDKNAKVIQLNVAETALNRNNVIIDSGTTDTYYNNMIGTEFRNAWKSLASTVLSHDAVQLTTEQLQALPTILIQLQGNVALNQELAASTGAPVVGLAGDLDPDNPYDVILAIPASHYFEYDETDQVYTNRFYVEESGGTVLGANAMMGHDVFFDSGASTVAFAESSCDYEALVLAFKDKSGIAPMDNGDSRQSGQTNGDADGLSVGDDAGVPPHTDDGGIDVYPNSTAGTATLPSGSVCDKYPCQAIFMVGGMVIVSMLIISLVVRWRRRGPRYSEATMSELELRVTSSIDDSEDAEFANTYRDMHGREIT